MKKLTNIVLFCTISLLFFTSEVKSEILRGPYTEGLGQDSAIVMFESAYETPAWLEYGIEPNCSQIMSFSENQEFHKIYLYGLVPNQQFCYKAYIFNEDKSGLLPPIEGKFRTLRSGDRKVMNFSIFGNTFSLSEVNKMLMAQTMLKLDSDFVVHTGNLTYSGSSQEEADIQFFSPFKDLLVQQPLFINVGKNEYGTTLEDRQDKRFLRNNFNKLHIMPWSAGTPRYYSLNSANAKLLFLDASDLESAKAAPSIEKTSEQIKWLRLELSKAGDMWKIIFINHPLYPKEDLQFSKKLQTILAPTMQAYKVNLVVHGYEQQYMRTEPIKYTSYNDHHVTHINIGGQEGASVEFDDNLKSYIKAQGNWKLEKKAKDIKGDYIERNYTAPHFANVKIVDRKLILTVYNLEGKIVDKVEVYK
ncbi:MAG: hypothetical protein HN833_00240 [Elusimicrobiaceae bacterium]|jgi:hypothetical protein|nr:hypothetical protein [Elusimicrobiaceae bacterium]MBT3954708.1 hypothetical protein [Elusimicrobiaceae bacterium]MBT4007735.1 hypothetical protein [Elusimicrobiaceae bacterium]MBT4402797.1 hypothetical protein [Elusimicrobiaceae bacterium]MBT4439412.1 hypothetical protein [Elusimicrobiaceae bacterium]